MLISSISTAAQFVIEEKIMMRYRADPLVAVGLEGVFGLTTVLLLIPIVYSSEIREKYAIFDVIKGWHQTVGNPKILTAQILMALSVSVFNFCGMSITRQVSANVWTIADACRTLVIWLLSLSIGWEWLVWPISLLQLTGFAILV
jgi:hypothetical protein